MESGNLTTTNHNSCTRTEQPQSQKNSTDVWRPFANNFVYTAAGAVSSLKLGNGKFENTQFNSRLQPTQIGLGASASTQNLLKLNFDYGTTDNNGNVKSQMITVPTVGAIPGFVATQNYIYDSLNRIKQATETIPSQTGWQQTFVYDRYGNRRFDTTANATTTLDPSCVTAVCNPEINTVNNRLVGSVFDTSGNTTTNASGQTFIYDAENKQVQVNDANGIVGQYFYDGEGKRVKKIAPRTGEITVFVYDADGKLIQEHSTIVASPSEAKISYLTNDHLGSPRITTDQLGQTISKRDFMPFGEEIARANYGSDTVRQKFTGYERDYETGLDFAQARYHASNLGRFSSPDPYLPIVLTKGKGSSVGEELKRAKFTAQPQNWSRYHYTTNNPLKYTDSSGEIPVLAVAGQAAKEVAKKAAIGAAIGAFFGGGVEAAVQLYDQGRITDSNRIVNAAGEGAIFGAFTGGAGPVSNAVGNQIVPRVIAGLVGSNVAGTGVRTVTGQETTTGDVLTDTLAGGLGSATGALASSLKTQQARLYVTNATLESVVNKIPYTRGTYDGARRFYIPMYSQYGDSYIGNAVRSGVKWVVDTAGGYGEVVGYRLDSPCKKSQSENESNNLCN